RRGDQARLLKGELILVRKDRGLLAAVAGVRAGVGQTVDDVHLRAVGAERDVLRRVGGRDQGRRLIGIFAFQRDHGDRVVAVVHRIQAFAIRGDRGGDRLSAGVVRTITGVLAAPAVMIAALVGQDAARRAGVDRTHYRKGDGVNGRDLVGVLLGDEQLGLIV